MKPKSIIFVQFPRVGIYCLALVIHIILLYYYIIPQSQYLSSLSEYESTIFFLFPAHTNRTRCVVLLTLNVYMYDIQRHVLSPQSVKFPRRPTLGNKEIDTNSPSSLRESLSFHHLRLHLTLNYLIFTYFVHNHSSYTLYISLSKFTPL